jgi:hypothetical protein
MCAGHLTGAHTLTITGPATLPDRRYANLEEIDERLERPGFVRGLPPSGTNARRPVWD